MQRIMEGFIMNPLILYETPFETWIKGYFFFTSQKDMLDHAYIYG